MQLILGSSSKSRLVLLRSVHVYPNIVYSPDVSEDLSKKEKIKDGVRRLSNLKIQKVLDRYGKDNYITLCADTLVQCNYKIFGKPYNAESAAEMIHYLSGRKHQVVTCVNVFSPLSKTICSCLVVTKVQFKKLTKFEIENYLQTNEWCGCCGSYCLNGYAGGFIISIKGSCSNIRGLPLYETLCLLNNPQLQNTAGNLQK